MRIPFRHHARTAVPLLVTLTLAVQKFNTDSRGPAAGSGENEPTIEDYMKFGK